MLNKIEKKEKEAKFPIIRLIFFAFCTFLAFYDSLLAGIIGITSILTLFEGFWDLIDKNAKVPSVVRFVASWVLFAVCIALALLLTNVPIL